MDKSTVCNMALRLLGEHEYVSGTPGHAACELFFAQVYKEVLSAGYWTFARRRVRLHADGDSKYPLPHDCLNIERLDGMMHWAVCGDCVVPNNRWDVVDEVWVTYTSSTLANRAEVPDRNAAFIRALVCHLAAACCVPVTNDERRRQALEQEYQIWLTTALTQDAKQDNSNDQHPLERIMNGSIVNGYGR